MSVCLQVSLHFFDACQATPAANRLPVLHFFVSSALLVEPVHPTLHILLEMPSFIPTVALASTVAATRPSSIVHAFFSRCSILCDACGGSLHFSPFVFQRPYYHCCESCTTPSNGFIFGAFYSSSLIYLCYRANFFNSRPCSSIFYGARGHDQLLSAPKSETANTVPRGFVTAFLHKPLAHCNQIFSKLARAIVDREDCVLELKLSSSAVAATEVAFCSQSITLKTEIASVRAGLSAAHSSLILSTAELNQLRIDRDHLESGISDLSFTVVSMRLFIQPSSFASLLRLLNHFVVSATIVWIFSDP